MARILIIDDDVQFRSMLRKRLERAGYEVAEAPDRPGGDQISPGSQLPPFCSGQ